MTVETKYNPGQRVWLINERKPRAVLIDSVVISIKSDGKPKISYMVQLSPFEKFAVGESVIGATLEELKTKLFG